MDVRRVDEILEVNRRRRPQVSCTGEIDRSRFQTDAVHSVQLASDGDRPRRIDRHFSRSKWQSGSIVRTALKRRVAALRRRDDVDAACVHDARSADGHAVHADEIEIAADLVGANRIDRTVDRDGFIDEIDQILRAARRRRSEIKVCNMPLIERKMLEGVDSVVPVHTICQHVRHGSVRRDRPRLACVRFLYRIGCRKLCEPRSRHDPDSGQARQYLLRQ